MTGFGSYDHRVGAPLFPVSVKGVVPVGGGILLLENERREWELPGGRLEDDETPEGCLAREVLEETGLEISVGPLLDAWVYEVLPGSRVLSYGCRVVDGHAEPIKSVEHSALGVFGPREVELLNMPERYRRATRRWSNTST